MDKARQLLELHKHGALQTPKQSWSDGTEPVLTGSFLHHFGTLVANRKQESRGKHRHAYSEQVHAVRETL